MAWLSAFHKTRPPLASNKAMKGGENGKQGTPPRSVLYSAVRRKSFPNYDHQR